MSFEEVQFPVDIAEGARGGPGYSTSIVKVDSGQEYRNSRWSQARRRYQIGYGIRDMNDLVTIIEFYTAVLGPAIGFRFKDWSDFSTGTSDNPWSNSNVTDQDVILGTGNGTQTEFQLKKIYTLGSLSRTRNLTKPVSGTVALSLDGVAQNEGSDFTVNTTTGKVLFNAAPATGVVVAGGCEFDVPVTFGEELDDRIDVVVSNFEQGEVPDISLVETLDTEATIGDTFYGGAVELNVTANKQLTVSGGRLVVFTTDDNTRQLNAPDPTNLDTGGPYFTLVNGGDTNNGIVADDSGSSLLTLTPGQSASLWLTEDLAGVKIWYAIRG